MWGLVSFLVSRFRPVRAYMTSAKRTAPGYHQGLLPCRHSRVLSFVQRAFLSFEFAFLPLASFWFATRTSMRCLSPSSAFIVCVRSLLHRSTVLISLDRLRPLGNTAAYVYRSFFLTGYSIFKLCFFFLNVSFPLGYCVFTSSWMAISELLGFSVIYSLALVIPFLLFICSWAKEHI